METSLPLNSEQFDIDILLREMHAFPFFEGIGDEYIRAFLRHTHIESFSEGDIIIRQGETSNGKAYIIVSGTVNIIIDEKKVSEVTTGSIFGEYALISDEERTATVVACTNLMTFVIGEESLLGFMGMSDTINRMIMDRVKENIRNKYGVFRDS